jgi:hypothetical protein
MPEGARPEGESESVAVLSERLRQQAQWISVHAKAIDHHLQAMTQTAEALMRAIHPLEEQPHA